MNCLLILAFSSSLTEINVWRATQKGSLYNESNEHNAPSSKAHYQNIKHAKENARNSTRILISFDILWWRLTPNTRTFCAQRFDNFQQLLLVCSLRILFTSKIAIRAHGGVQPSVDRGSDARVSFADTYVAFWKSIHSTMRTILTKCTSRKVPHPYVCRFWKKCSL